MSNSSALVRVENIKKYFKIRKNETLKAVDGLNFNIDQGETFGIVGESGCGKSTLGNCLVRLYRPTAGNIFFADREITVLNKRDAFAFTGQVQMIFQNPYSSLNPRMTIGDLIGEGLDLHQDYSRAERVERIDYLLHLVGLDREHSNRFPHEFSGGQRQRIGIARALSVEPDFIVCDEPVSALDVSIQSQVLNLIKKLQAEMGLTYLFISHNLSVVKYIADRIGVMYLGNIVEEAEAEKLYQQPLHPYSRALLSSIPLPDPRKERQRKRLVLEGDVPSPINYPACCKFLARCSKAEKVCGEKFPELKEVTAGHYVACHLI
ncbi:MAG: ABC transporter ATP-binding protein [Halanaerobiales bacterium]|nr:ABC transporter ATP-binding protein [Halanaerobiales bacterium]